VLVPESHTYRRAHTWGKKTKTEDEVTYRSRSITGLIYSSEKIEHNAKELIEMSPLNFEEYCHEVMSKLGWIITKQRQVDGGIDVEAYKSTGEGQIKRAFVQCKHWSRPVGPDVVRELLGSNVVEGEEYETELFIICSGTFSSGCIELANKHNVKLLDGNDLLKLAN
ncbi:restriction endonuclease, partial [Candidatus Pelagibacter sp.]|nr:restriction endonuclease [Candidatus Pelagibacter sp.]